MGTGFDPLKFKDTKFKIRKITEGATIEGVYAKNLKTWVDGRGDLTEIWSLSWEDKDKLAPIEHVYYNLTDQGVTKGWHWHTKTFSQFVCPAGKMQVVLFDLRQDSPSFGEVNQFICSSKNPMYIKIPPYVLKGWKALEPGALIINLLSSKGNEDNFKVPVATFLPDIWQPIPE
ncbi:dTDP-4-dehydrorhamnose 3,5-epimerase family protein [Candidatus Microgenomates bacterium]|nr:dTDP-4-dehydrorhamnose 3,5-epimerase family protein [Candidatus Microgenomates bacterium]